MTVVYMKRPPNEWIIFTHNYDSAMLVPPIKMESNECEWLVPGTSDGTEDGGTVL